MGAGATVLELVTRCASVDEFVERFARFTTETDMVVPALPHVTVGTVGRFVIRLQDQSVIMAGRGEVSEVLPLAPTPGATPRAIRALMRLRLIEMDAHTCGIHLRLSNRRASSSKAPSAAPSAPPPPSAPPSAPAARSLSLVRTPPLMPLPGVTRPTPDRSVNVPAPPPPAPPARATAVATPQAPRISPAATLIGLPRSLGPTAATVMAAAAPAESEPTQISFDPPPEARVAGALFTLPANPLSDLDAADLSSFIELTLLEAQGAAENAAALSAQTAAEAAQNTPPPATFSPPVSVPSRSSGRTKRASTAPRPDGPTERVLRIARRLGPHVRVLGPHARRFGPYLAGAFIGLLVGFWLRSGPHVAPVVVAPKPASPSEIAPPSAPAAPAPTEDPEIRTGPRRECVAQVTTKPPGAEIVWGGVALGPSPIEGAAIPCGRATVTVRHERYADVTRTITAERGQSAILSEKLSRPSAKVVVTSSPPNALIKLNRRAFGAAPRRIGTMRFEQVRIDASLPGYQHWAKTVYLKEPETKVEVTLVPLRKANVRRAAAAAAAARAAGAAARAAAVPAPAPATLAPSPRGAPARALVAPAPAPAAPAPSPRVAPARAPVAPAPAPAALSPYQRR